MLKRVECFTLKVCSLRTRTTKPLSASPQPTAQDKQIDGINKCKVYLNELRMMYALRHRHIVRHPA